MTNLPFDKPLDNETSKAFQCFTIYRDLGSDRSLDKAYQLSKDNVTLKANGTWRKWSEKHHWVDRAKAYDAYLIEKSRQAREEEHLKELGEYRDELGRLSRLTMNTGKLVLARCLKRIQSMSEQEIDKLDVKHVSALMRAANDSIEKGMDGWGMALAVDDLVDMLESEE